MEFRILGPLEVLDEGRGLPLGGAKQRALLAILLLHAGEVVSTDRLMDDLWGEEPPATAANALQVYVSQLRKVLGRAGRGSEILVTRRPGYLLRAEVDELDLARFRSLAAAGREALAAGDAAGASTHLHQALGLWRGPALADFTLEEFAQQDIETLEEQRKVVLEDRFEADLALGRAADLVPELEPLVRADPLRERLREHLMLALYRAGRQADALACYQDAMRVLGEDLGIDPSPTLQRLHEAILRQDPTLEAPPRPPAPAPDAPPSIPPGGSGVPGEDIAATDDQLLPVTALVAELEGLGSLRDRLSQAEVTAVAGESVGRMRREAERLGAAVVLEPERIRSYFGIPAAHEDDPERAARAALRIVAVVDEQAREIAQAWGVEGVGVRIGINAGRTMAAAASGGAPSSSDPGTVAAHLSRAAEPGTIVVGSSAARRLSGRFQLEPGGEVVVEGRAEPVAVQRLVGVRSEEDPTPSTPLLGRDRELGALERVVEDLSVGRGQVLLIQGEPGQGKSRMLSELRPLVPAGARWLEGRCPPRGSDLPFGPIADMVRRWIGVGEDDPEMIVRTRLRTHVEAAGIDDPAVLHQLGRILSIRVDPLTAPTLIPVGSEELARRAAAAVRTWVAALCEAGPTVVAVEDLHDADVTARRCLEEVLALTEAAPLLLVATSRHDPASEGWAFWVRCLGEYRHRATELQLSPLTPAAAAELADTLAPTGVLDEVTKREILERADGNPLYIEELVRALSELGGLARSGRSLSMTATGALLPPALENLLAVRVQRLPEAARRTAQIAAVIGREFPLVLLRAASQGEVEDVEGALTTLLRTEIVREVRRDPDAVCRFRHALLQQAVLSTLPAEREAEINGRIATALETLYAGELEDHLERLATYAYRSDDALRALRFVEAAGERAASLEQPERAAALFRRAARSAERAGDAEAGRRIEARLAALAGA